VPEPVLEGKWNDRVWRLALAAARSGPGEKGQIAMRKLVLDGLSLWILVALAWAGDVWKDKTYQQWDKADVQKILNDSPWVKVAHVDVPGASLSGQSGLPGGNSGATAAASRAAAGKGGVGGAGAPSGATPGEMGGETGANVPQIPFMVRWLSSRTIREALVRNAELSGQVKQADAERDLATPVEMYEVLVFGPQMDVFGAAAESALKENVLLTCKKTKEKISPATVNIQRTPDGKTIRAIVFSFPKQTAASEPTIASTEKTVEFSCALPRVKFKVSFDLPKMEDAKGRDL
jgi:hypothetical protein